MENIKIKALALNKYLDCVLDATPDEVDTLLKYHSEAYSEALKEEFIKRDEFTKELVDGDYMFFAFIHKYQLLVAYTKYVEKGKFVYIIEDIAVSETSKTEVDDLQNKLAFMNKANVELVATIEEEMDKATMMLIDLEEETEEIDEKIAELIDRKEIVDKLMEDYNELLEELEKELEETEQQIQSIPSLYKTVFLHEEECGCECGCDCKCKH